MSPRMGLESRDWYRDGSRTRRRVRPAVVVIALVLIGLVVGGLALSVIQASQPTFQGEERTVKGDLKLTLLPGLPSITLKRESLYWPNDQWKDYLADERTCPGGERTDLPLAEQANVMACLVDFARQRRGLRPLTTVGLLNASSLAKASRIVECRQFEHTACGAEPDSDARAQGYRGAFGENLYIGSGRLGAPRVALDGWLNSPGHRENLFRPEWRTQGLAVRTVDDFGEYRHATIWVNQFGDR